jgi:hypothetical protein
MSAALSPIYSEETPVRLFLAIAADLHDVELAEAEHEIAATDGGALLQVAGPLIVGGQQDGAAPHGFVMQRAPGSRSRSLFQSVLAAHRIVPNPRHHGVGPFVRVRVDGTITL